MDLSSLPEVLASDIKKLPPRQPIDAPVPSRRKKEGVVPGQDTDTSQCSGCCCACDGSTGMSHGN